MAEIKSKIAKPVLTPIERFMMPNPAWQEGYASFTELFGKPLGWLALCEEGKHHLVRLNRKQNCPFFAKNEEREQGCKTFLDKFVEQLVQDNAVLENLPKFYRCAFGKNCIVFVLRHFGAIKGFLIFCCVKRPERELKDLVPAFAAFVSTHVELAYKNFELNNFYETVHPRALALSTMHSVHRVISSSLYLKDLLPRIGRLSAQILKAQGCSIMLTDSARHYLLPFFSMGKHPKFIHKHRVKFGRGVEGRIAETGEFCLNNRYVAVPFIEDDIVGVLTLWGKVDGQVFTRTDLEILKSLAEQAVVAIKNAQLFEQTEELTLGSIRTINELLRRNFDGNQSDYELMAQIVVLIGKEMQLLGPDLTYLERAVLLLETGQLAFAEQTWKKKDNLTQKEVDEIHSIPIRGANLLRSISSLKPVLPIVMHHHERYDGKGYPQGLKAEEIPLGARIVAVADSFVAMISVRQHRKALSVKAAMDEIIAHKCLQFDPLVVDVFLKIINDKSLVEKLGRYVKRNG